MKKVLLALALLLLIACKKETPTPTILSPANIQAMKVQLGKSIFFDKNLSNPIGQSCSSCHAPETAFSDLSHNAVSKGALDGLFSNRNAPSIVYSMYSP